MSYLLFFLLQLLSRNPVNVSLMTLSRRLHRRAASLALCSLIASSQSLDDAMPEPDGSYAELHEALENFWAGRSLVVATTSTSLASGAMAILLGCIISIVGSLARGLLPG